MKYVANLPYASIGDKDGKPGTAPGRRRGSSVGFRRPSATSRFNSNLPRNVVHISADNGPGSGSAIGMTSESRFNYSRDSWPSSPFASSRDTGNMSNPQRAIRADTTITISENDEVDRKTSEGPPHGRTGSQEQILPAGSATSTPPDYGWCEPRAGGTSNPDDVETGIPMMPMRAKTNNRFG